MFGVRGSSILVLNLALAAFTFGCSSDGGVEGAGGAAGIRADFETSLHKTREGQRFWYSAASNGFESLVNVAYEDMTCPTCHNKNDASWAGEATCADCHDSGGMGGAGGGGMAPPKHLDSDTCLGCHGRQNAEAGKLQAADYHTDRFACSDCHKSNDVHGNGTEYDTMLRPGAIAVRCIDCHNADGPGEVPPSDSFHGAQHTAVDCALCHTETVISCINCHLEDDVDHQQKCASAQIFNWKFVMKWDKDGNGNEVYHPATIMTVKYNCDRAANDVACTDQATDPKKTVAVFAPYYAHTVTEQATDNILAFPAGPAPYDDPGCTYCHGAANCDTIVNAGQGTNEKQKLIQFADGKLSNPISGLIPLPNDYGERFAIDYVEWQEGAGTNCPTPEMPKPLVIFETGPDLWQTGEDTNAPNERQLGAPLSQTEFEKFCPPNN